MYRSERPTSKSHQSTPLTTQCKLLATYMYRSEIEETPYISPHLVDGDDRQVRVLELVVCPQTFD